MIDFTCALTGALRGQARYFFNEAPKENARILAHAQRAQRRLIFTLMRISCHHEFDGWRYVPGVKTDDD